MQEQRSCLASTFCRFLGRTSTLSRFWSVWKKARMNWYRTFSAILVRWSRARIQSTRRLGQTRPAILGKPLPFTDNCFNTIVTVSTWAVALRARNGFVLARNLRGSKCGLDWWSCMHGGPEFLHFPRCSEAFDGNRGVGVVIGSSSFPCGLDGFVIWELSLVLGYMLLSIASGVIGANPAIKPSL